MRQRVHAIDECYLNFVGVLQHVCEFILHVFNLFNVDVFELFLHGFDPGLHGIDCVFGVFQGLCGHIGLFHVERLVSKVVGLAFVLLLLPQQPVVKMYV